MIKGYGPIKETSVARYERQLQQLLAAFRSEPRVEISDAKRASAA